MRKIVSSILMLGALGIVVCEANAATKFDPPEATVNNYYQIEGNWSELKKGWSTLVLKISDQDQKPVVGATVTVAYDMVGMPMNPPNKPVVDKGDGTYEKPVFVGMRGNWRFDVTVEDNARADGLSHLQKIMQ